MIHKIQCFLLHASNSTRSLTEGSSWLQAPRHFQGKILLGKLCLQPHKTQLMNPWVSCGYRCPGQTESIKYHCLSGLCLELQDGRNPASPVLRKIDAFMEEDTFQSSRRLLFFKASSIPEPNVTIDYWLLIISSTLSLQKTTSEMLPTVEVQEYWSETQSMSQDPKSVYIMENKWQTLSQSACGNI